jgi:acyl carrier protein
VASLCSIHMRDNIDDLVEDDTRLIYTPEQAVADAIMYVFGTLPASKDEPLANMGLDSLDAMDLIYRIEDNAGVPKLFDTEVKIKMLTQQMLEDQLRARLKCTTFKV